MYGEDEVAGKTQHYYYLEKLFRRVSFVFSQLSEMVTDLEGAHDVLEAGCVISRADCVYRSVRSRKKFDRKKALPFALFIEDAIERCQHEHPDCDLVDCIDMLKTEWDDPRYGDIREMYEYVASERTDGHK